VTHHHLSYRSVATALGLLVAVCAAPAALAQDVLPPARNMVEFGTMLHRYSDGIDPWNGIYLRTQIASGARNLWLGEVVAEDRLGEQAFAYKVEYVLDQPRWFARAGFRTSTSGIYNPEWRTDLRLGVKTGPERRLLLMGSGFHQKIRDGHKDTGFAAEVQYYGGPAWIVQGAARWTYSTPGDVWSRYFDAALTLGRYGKRNVTLHGAFGTEAYQIIGPLDILVDFDSWMARLVWREWLSRKVGFTVSGIWYENDYYTRGGVEAGLFIHFGDR
jgi:YaiO family outer membrane protein